MKENNNFKPNELNENIFNDFENKYQNIVKELGNFSVNNLFVQKK